jgi:hypothetical protein
LTRLAAVLFSCSIWNATARSRNDDASHEEVLMATADECREALDRLLGQISELDPEQRAANLVERTLSCEVPDLGLTFWTKVSPDGAEPARLAGEGDGTAQVRFVADSGIVVSISEDPMRFAKLWLGGRVKVHASWRDVLRLRKFL